MANINIGGRLHSTATGNVVAGANEILDDTKGKKQSVINQETDEALAGKQAALVSGTNIKTVNGESILGSGNIQAGDPDAIKYSAQTLTDAQKTQARTNIGAYNKPATGIPATDLASAAQTSLGKADTAYQKPQGGVPKSDLASGVQGSLDLADTAVQAENVGPILPPPETDEFATKTQVTQLEHKVDGLITGATLEDKGIVWSDGYVHGSTGVVTSSTASQFSQPVLLKAGQTIKYLSGTAYPKAVVKVANDNPVQVGDTLSGDTLIASTANTVAYYTASEDTYIVISVQKTSFTIDFIVLVDDSVDERIRNIETEKYDSFPDSGYIYKSTGAVAAHASYKHTDYIPCHPGDVFFCHISCTDNACVAFYNADKGYIKNSGVNVATPNTTITVPVGAYFLRACNSPTNVAYPYIQRVSTQKSLQDIPDKVFTDIWEKYADDSDANLWTRFLDNSKWPMTRGDVYNMVKSIRLYGFDNTKKHTLYILWNNTNIFSFRISEYNGSSWSSVFEYTLTTFTPSQTLSFDYETGGKRVVASLDFGDYRFDSSTLNALSGTPELVFAKTVYFDEDVNLVAGDGIEINGNTISVDADTLPVQESVLLGEGVFYDITASAFSESGVINKTSGAAVAHASYYHTDYLPVKPGQKYKTNAKCGDSACIAFYSTNVYTSFLGYVQNASGDATIITVPSGAYYMRMSTNPTTGRYATLQNPEYKGLVELTTVTEKENTKPIATPIRLSPMTKLPCVSFQFDDNPANDALIVALFKSYAKTCGFAFIASSGNTTSEGERYMQYQKEGFQILNHSVSGTALTSANMNEETAWSYIRNAKKRLNGAGMVVNGFVCPSSEIEASWKYMLKLLHAYAFTTSTSDPTVNGTTADRCDLHRYSIQSNPVASIEQFIDDCITNNQIITFYGHAADLVENGDVTQWSIAKITAIIEYCIAKEDAGLLYFAGSDECVKYFFDL